MIQKTIEKKKKKKKTQGWRMTKRWEVGGMKL